MHSKTVIIALFTAFMATATALPQSEHAGIMAKREALINKFSRRSCDSDGCNNCKTDCDAFATGPGGSGVAEVLCQMGCGPGYGCNQDCQ